MSEMDVASGGQFGNTAHGQTLVKGSYFAGIIASALCVVHCTILPVVLTFAPALAHFVPGSEITHRVLASLVVGIGALAFRGGFRVHRRKIVPFLMVLGATGVVTGAFVASLLRSHGWEVGITLAGSILMVTAPWLNRAFCRVCQSCESVGRIQISKGQSQT